MAARPVRARDKDSLADFLGWFGVVLGSAQLAVPRALCRLVGAKDEGAAPTVMRLQGLRELTQGLGILVRPRPTAWLWTRVAGDALDLSLLGLVAARNPGRRIRTALAIANVAAVTAPDVYESLHLTRKPGEPVRGRRIRKAITLRLPRDEVESAWTESHELREKLQANDAVVSFDEAPGGRGTELAVDLVFDPPAGDLGKAALKLTGRDLATQLADDLRRFKQQLETGQVVRSDATPDGHLLAEHLKQRAAQPLEEAIR